MYTAHEIIHISPYLDWVQRVVSLEMPITRLHNQNNGALPRKNFEGVKLLHKQYRTCIFSQASKYSCIIDIYSLEKNIERLYLKNNIFVPFYRITSSIEIKFIFAAFVIKG